MKSCLPRVPARGEHIYHDILSMQSVLMRDVFAALLRYGEFASQFHLRPLAIPSWELYGSDMDGQKSYSTLEM